MGRYRYRVDPNNPIAAARCDYSGFIVPRTELVKQMQYQGLSLVWTGLWVWKKFADQPNPAQLTPLLKADPAPIPNPRADIDVTFNLDTETGLNLITEDGDNLIWQ